jgi:hypothetical protein
MASRKTSNVTSLKVARALKYEELRLKLSFASLGVLLTAHYENPIILSKNSITKAELLELELVEENPTNPGECRATRKGVLLIQHLARKHHV